MANWLLNKLVIDGTKEEIKEILPQINWEMNKKCIKEEPYTLFYETTFDVLEDLLLSSKRYPNVTFYLTSVEDSNYGDTVQDFPWITFELLGPTIIFKNEEILATFEHPEIEFVAYKKYLNELKNSTATAKEIDDEYGLFN